MFLNTVWRQLKAEAYSCASCSKTIYISTKRYLKKRKLAFVSKKKKKKKKKNISWLSHCENIAFSGQKFINLGSSKKPSPSPPTPRKSNGRPQSKT